MDNLTVLVGSCDKYSFLWNDFFSQYFRCCSEWNLPTILLSETRQYHNTMGVKCALCGDRSYSKCLNYVLSGLTTDWVMWLQDDYIIVEKFPKKELKSLYEYAVRNDVDRLGIHPDCKYYTYKIVGNNIRQYSCNSQYLVSMQASLWKRDFLLSTLDKERNETPWQLEIEGTRRLQKRSVNIRFVDKFWYFEAMKKGIETEDYKEWKRLDKQSKLRVDDLRREESQLTLVSKQTSAVTLAKSAELRFQREFQDFKLAGSKTTRFRISCDDLKPCLLDRTPNAVFDEHYVYHTGWAARILAKTQPREHVDFGSSLYFASIVSAFIPLKIYDFRASSFRLDNVIAGKADLCALPFQTNSIFSISCMHVVEHIGLGRYGDPLDPNADLAAMAELVRVLAPGGRLLFVVPVGGIARVVFNAHRIYRFKQIIDIFEELDLEEFALIPDSTLPKGLLRNPPEPEALTDQNNYGCGCFSFKKR